MKRANVHKNLKTIGIVAKNPKNALGLVDFFSKHGIEVMFGKRTASNLGIEGFSLDEICEKTNLIISLGGDGTLISTCRKIARKGYKDVHVLGIYDGTLGFLTDIDLNELEQFFDEFLEGKYDVERPLMLEITLKKQGKKDINKIAFNDIVLTRSAVISMSKVDAYLNGKYFNTYYGDGVIVSSPVGSTAYNMSANGPIIYPLSKTFCITPICSHSLTQRPVVLPSEYKLSFKNMGSSNVSIVIDGQDSFDMSEFDEVFITIGSTHANLIRHLDRDYFDVLKEKLHWGHNGGKA
ncbi:MAG: NAD(+) kinase [Campylobacteraceae bacterium]|nr:NAD(+) kinase [Campylobacteraceae bacterium]